MESTHPEIFGVETTAEDGTVTVKTLSLEGYHDLGLASRERWQRVCRIGNTTVSTVFLGIDHEFRPNGPGVWYETMIFGGDRHDGYQRRYRTRAEAEAGHEAAVRLVRGS